MNKEPSKIVPMYEAFEALVDQEDVTKLLALMEEAQQGRVVQYEKGRRLVVFARGDHADATYRSMYPTPRDDAA